MHHKTNFTTLFSPHSFWDSLCYVDKSWYRNFSNMNGVTVEKHDGKSGIFAHFCCSDTVLQNYIHVKGTLSRDFRPPVFSSNNSIWALDPRIKAFLHMASYSRRYSTMKLIFCGQECQWHWRQLCKFVKMVSGVNDTAERWWAVSMTPLTIGGRCQWHRWPK
jgi:hypothetical protein